MSIGLIILILIFCLKPSLFSHRKMFANLKIPDLKMYV